MISYVDAQTLKSWLKAAQEISVLDVREVGQFSNGHLFFASNLPYSRLEIDIQRLVPRVDTRIVLCDEGQLEIAARAAACLAEMGSPKILLLSNGVGGGKVSDRRVGVEG